MRLILLIFCILMILIIILNYPLKIKGVFYVDVLKLSGFFVMKVLMIRLVCEKLNIDQNGRIIIEREKLPKKQNKKQEFLKNDYFKTLLVKLELQNLEAYFVVGSNGNASGLSIFTGALLSGMTMLCSLLKNKYGRMKVVTNVQTIYTQDVGEVSLGFTIRFSLMDMIKAKLFAYKDYNKIKREVKNGQ